jgi:hypothetical protein
LYVFMMESTPTPTVVPTTRGGIQLEWHTHGLDIEIYIYAPNNVRFFAEHHGSGQSVEASLVGQEHILKSWIDRISAK